MADSDLYRLAKQWLDVESKSHWEKMNQGEDVTELVRQIGISAAEHRLAIQHHAVRQVTGMNFNWPIEDNWNHCNVKSVLERPDIEPFWSDLHRAVNGIHWDELIELHNHEHNHRMSMSTAISERLDYEFTRHRCDIRRSNFFQKTRPRVRTDIKFGKSLGQLRLIMRSDTPTVFVGS